MRLACLVLLLSVSSPSDAILIRPDRDDAEYLELATKYSASVMITPTGGEGVLIAPRWLLTSSDVALLARDVMKVKRITIAGDEHAIDSFFIHPAGKPGPVNDIALILLKTASGVEPARLYQGTDEKGKAVIVVGHGGVMKIGERARPGMQVDRRARAFINTVDRVTPNTLGLEVKGVDEASDLQGVTTALDHGAPAYIEMPGAILVAGIAHRLENANRNDVMGDAGDIDLFMRVSAYAPWIEAVMLDVAKKEMEAIMDPDRR